MKTFLMVLLIVGLVLGLNVLVGWLIFKFLLWVEAPRWFAIGAGVLIPLCTNLFRYKK